MNPIYAVREISKIKLFDIGLQMEGAHLVTQVLKTVSGGFDATDCRYLQQQRDG